MEKLINTLFSGIEDFMTENRDKILMFLMLFTAYRAIRFYLLESIIMIGLLTFYYKYKNISDKTEEGVKEVES